MALDMQNITLWALSLALAVLGWFLRSLHYRQNELEKDHEKDARAQAEALGKLHLELVASYIRKDELIAIVADFKRDTKEALDRVCQDVNTTISRIEARLDQRTRERT
jgi:hypothetical protein